MQIHRWWRWWEWLPVKVGVVYVTLTVPLFETFEYGKYSSEMALNLITYSPLMVSLLGGLVQAGPAVGGVYGSDGGCVIVVIATAGMLYQEVW